MERMDRVGSLAIMVTGTRLVTPLVVTAGK
jgi:hypothetical protein